MNFEDEKDILGNNPESIDDDAISWDSILDTDEDGIVSIKVNNASPTRVPTEVFTNDIAIPDLDTIGSDDEVEYITPVDDEDEVDEEEYKRILSSDDSSNSEYEYADTNDFNINNESSQTPDIQADEADEIEPRKEEIKKQPPVSPVLLALLVGLLVIALIYAIFTFVLNREDDDDFDMPRNEAAKDADVENKDENPDENPQQPAAQDANIPVVNEDDVSGLKPEEKKEEKKEVVNIIPTGRVNPFMPLQKFIYVAPPKPAPPKPITITKTINNIDYDSVKIPHLRNTVICRKLQQN